MGRTTRQRKRHKITIKDENKFSYELFKFLSEKGWRNESQLTVKSFPLTGRGLNSKCKLSENDMIIDLPISSMITIVNLENDEEFHKLFDLDALQSLTKSINFQSLLALYLQNEMLKKTESYWKSYIETLPTKFTTPFFCNKSELYFIPDFILMKVVEQNGMIKRNFEELMKVVKLEYRLSFTLSDFKWAYFVCNTRSVFLNSNVLQSLCHNEIFKEILSDSANMALAPLLDLLNHSSEASTKNQLSGSNTNISYQLQTLKPIKKYEQIFINYGVYNNTKLLVEYGFIVPDNQVDFLEFSLEDVNNYIKNHKELKFMTIPKHKYKFIRDHDLEQQIFIDLVDGLSHNFKAILCILILPENLYNLEQVAFGDEINFERIKFHATNILERKKIDFQEFIVKLEHLEDLSDSGEVCIRFFRESINFIDKVLKLISI